MTLKIKKSDWKLNSEKASQKKGAHHDERLISNQYHHPIL